MNTILLLLGTTLFVAAAFGQTSAPPAPGQPAPDFDTPSTAGGNAKLADFKGKWLVLYFYPKSFTSGCTKEACSLRDGFEGLGKLDAVVLGVSNDSMETQKKFKAEHKLPFELLADTDKKTATAYGTQGLTGFFSRKTFIIDPDGKIAHIFEKVDVNKHADEVAEQLSKLQAK